MTQLDKFTIDFETKNTSQTRAEIAAIDKQLEELGKKEHHRTEEESKQYYLLQKQRKQLLEDTKTQRRETDKLSDSFEKMVQNAVGAVTAYTSFGFLKNALVDANRLNTSLQNLGLTYSFTGREAKALGAAAARVGLAPEAAYSFLQAQGAAALAARRPFNDKIAEEQIARLRALAIQYPRGQAPPGFDTIPGALALLPLLQSPEYENARKGGFGVAGTPEDFSAAVKNEAAANKTAQELGAVATEINTTFSSAVEQFNKGVQSFIGIFQGAPGLGAVEGGLLGIGGTILAGKSLGAIARGLSGGAAIAGGAATAGGAGIGSLLLGGAAIAGGAWYLLGKEQDLINGMFGKKAGSSESQIPPSSSGIPLGIRSNNPGNLMPGGREAIFNSPSAGISALSSQLQRYGRRGWNTLGSILSHYAPAGSNDTQSYIASVARDTGFSPNQSLNLNDPLVLQKLIPAIIKHENGYNPYSADLIRQSIGVGDMASGGKTISIKIDDVNVHTAATDAAGIASVVGVELKNQIRMAMNTFDDGINA